MRDYANVLPVLLEADLYAAGWNGTINPYPGMDVRTKAIQSIRSSFLKKFRDDSTDAADKAALDLFLSINEQCRTFSLESAQLNDAETQAIGEARNFLYDFFYQPTNDPNNPEDFLLEIGRITDHFGLGNGANIGSPGTSFFSKVANSDLSCTNPALQFLFLQAIDSDPLWSDVESIRRQFRTTSVARGSRLSFVPKTAKISRTICTEPVLNMLFQKGIAFNLEQRLQWICGIDLGKQPDKNRKLAQLGSKNGKFGTIDLSSASDSMSIGLVKNMFPRRVNDVLGMCRCPLTILPDGTEVELHMMSSMGNAFTFPLQTLFFYSIVYGAYRTLDIHFERPFRQSLGNFAVFGDDIIVRKEAYNFVCRLLSICGFKVNVDKSFNEGIFRESCGHDYFDGHNVRGVYIQSLLSDGDRYSAINRLNVWSARWEISLSRTVGYLREGLRFLPIPFHEMDDAGIKIPLRSLNRRITNRYTGGIQYRYLGLVPRSFNMTDVGRQPPRRLRGYFHNHSGVLLAALAGTLRAGDLTIRDNRPRTCIRRRYSSSWDYIHVDPGLMPGISERWKSFVELNLNLS